MRYEILTAMWILSAQASLAAGIPVIDVANIANTAVLVVNQLEEMERTAKQIQYKVQSAQRFAQKLNGYKFTNIKGLLQDIRSFQHRARGIGYTYKSIVNQFEKTYGKRGDFSKNYGAWEKQSDDSIKDAMESQGLVGRSGSHMQDLDRALQSKEKAETSEEALQAVGEINAIQAKQLDDLKHIIATDARARQSVIMEERAKERVLKQDEANLMKDFNVHKPSRPLTHFPSLGSTALQR